MTPKPDPDDYSCFPVNILPELVCDFSDGQPSAPIISEREAPVNILPELVCDLTPGDTMPVLQLFVSLRADTPPGDIVRDLSRLHAALDQLERSHHGSGLLREAASGAAPTNGTLRITFRSLDPKSAVERLTELARAINSPDECRRLFSLQCRSIERCEAQVIPAAA